MLKMKELLISGNCSLDTIIGLKTGGPFNLTLHNVTAEGSVFLTVDPNGRLVANKSVSYMTYEEMTVSIEDHFCSHSHRKHCTYFPIFLRFR